MKKTDKRKLHKQINTNTRRMKVLMRDVKADVVRRTQNAKDTDEWLEKLSPYVNHDFLVTGIHADSMKTIINGICKAAEISTLPAGANQELTKGVIAECCYTYVTNATKELQNDMSRIAIETYNSPKETNRDLAKKLNERLDDFDKTRCRTIARTETMRASNLANHIQAKENGAMSYTVHCEDGACEACIETYGENEDVIFDINDTDDFPCLHPNCRCTPRYSTKTVEQRSEDS